jgi:hypothetical protein
MFNKMKTATGQITPQEIATFHNALVARYYKENPKGLQRSVTPKFFKSVGRTLVSYIADLGFNPAEVDKATEALSLNSRAPTYLPAAYCARPLSILPSL